MAETLQTVTNKLVEEKLGQFESASNADYKRISDDIAKVAKVTEDIPARIRAEVESLSARKAKQGIFSWLRKKLTKRSTVIPKDTRGTETAT
jgi:hypothetical protein